MRPYLASARDAETSAIHVETALDRAAARAWRYGVTPGTSRRLVTKTSDYVDTYSRALHIVERRQIMLRTVPAPKRARLRGPLPNPRTPDPWQVDPATIEDETRIIASCPRCNGSERVACPPCDGRGEIRCGGCSGSGRVRGTNRMKNCTVCRGRGTNGCSNCRSTGQVDCPECDASGKVEGWLSLTQTILQPVEVHPMGAAAQVHRRVDDPDDFDRSDTWVNSLVADDREVDTFDDHLQPALDRRADRILSTRVLSPRGSVSVVRRGSNAQRRAP